MKNKITKNWYKTNIHGRQRSFNIGCLILTIIALGFFFLILCNVLKFGFRREEIKQQEKFETYKMLETKLKEKKIVKIAMFRELNAVSWCESRHDDMADNADSSALGRFQIINSTLALCEKHLGRKLDRTNEKDSWDCAIFLYSINGLKDWRASKSCWAK